MREEHVPWRSGLRVEHDLANLLRAATPNGDPGSPRDSLLASRNLDDRKPADYRLGFRYRSGRDGPVRRNNGRLLALDTAAEDPDPRGLCLANHRMRRLAHRRPIFVGNMVHRAVIKRNQVPGHR